MTDKITTLDLETNVDRTIIRREGTQRKPMSNYMLNSLENLSIFNNFVEPSYAYTFYMSLLNGFSSVFDWEGLPEDIDKSFIEKKLLQGGRIKLIKVGKKYLAVNIAPVKYNYKEDVVKSHIIEPWLPKILNKITETFPNVEIRNNNLGISLIRIIWPYLLLYDRAMNYLDDHGGVLTGKFIYVSNDKTAYDNTALEDRLADWIRSDNPVKVLKGSMLDKDTFLDTLQIQDSVESFLTIIKWTISQILNQLGIPNNNNEDKKERLITSEISIQNILQSSILKDMLSWREKAVKEINKKFGFNIRVKLKEALMDSIEGRIKEVKDETKVSGNTKA